MQTQHNPRQDVFEENNAVHTPVTETTHSRQSRLLDLVKDKIKERFLLLIQ